MPVDFKGEWTLGFVSPSLQKRSTIVFGITGSGKSVLCERFSEIAYRAKKYKIVSCFDSKNDFESAWTAFPTRGRLKRILETSQSSEGLQKELTTPQGFPTRIYCPVSPKLPRTVPECIIPFTIPIQSIGRAELQFLCETTERNVTADFLAKVFESASASTTLPEILFSLRDPAKIIDPFGVSTEVPSRQIQKTASALFLSFSTNKFLSSSLNPLALTEKKLIQELNDQKTFCVFSARYIDDRKTQFFLTIWLLNKIIQLKREGKVKTSGICITINDLHVLCPRFASTEYEKTMTDLIYRFLTTSRSAGCEFLVNNQDVTTLSQRLAGQFSEVLTGFCWSPSELQYFAESAALLDSWSKWTISNLRYQKQKMFFDVFGKNTIPVLPPTFSHKSEGENFFETWKEHGFLFKDVSAQVKTAEAEFDFAVKAIRTKSSKQTEKTTALAEPPKGLLEKKRFVRADVEKSFDCSLSYAKKIIKNWMERGLIERKGKLFSKTGYYCFKSNSSGPEKQDKQQPVT